MFLIIPQGCGLFFNLKNQHDYLQNYRAALQNKRSVTILITCSFIESDEALNILDLLISGDVCVA